ncbi:hypothetical protein C1645_740280 [Glomus cerebriforme]|uniref:Uncharacterized protein n=1 Tax=Glomus cerebriforme TaxID=658196 RepID=A0A397SLZ1_9GLOM|nr:hypothetical protein C1645_740280 [Glomus cerebriforme]
MTNKSTKKPVNDLIKFWAEKQDKDVDPIPRSPRRPLSPTTSLPPSPFNESFYSKSSFKDIPSNTPPLTPTGQYYNNNNVHSLISEGSDNNNNDSVDNSNSRSIVDIQTSSSNKDDERMNYSSPLQQDYFSDEETSTDTTNTYTTRETSTNTTNTYSTRETSSNTSNTYNTSSTRETSTNIANTHSTKETSINTYSITKDSISRLRDHDLNTKDNKIGPLPPVRKVTDLVSKFEKVASPNNSVQTSPRLSPIKRSQTYAQSSPTSPTTLSPIKRNQLTPEPLLLSFPTSSTLSSKAKRRQTVPEPLNFSSKKFTDEPSSLTQHTISNKNCESIPVSPISPIGNHSIEIPNAKPISVLNLEQTSEIINTTLTTKQHIPESQIQKDPTPPIQKQESFSNQSLKNDKNDKTQIQKTVSETNSNPVIIPSIKQSDPEPLKKQTRPISFQSDYLDFVTEILQNSTLNLKNQKDTSEYVSRYSTKREFFLPEITSISPFWKPTTDTTPISPLLNPENGIKPVSSLQKLVSEKTKHSNTDSRNNTFKSRETTSSSSNNSSSLYEMPNLLPQPEPISPIRLSFSDFLISPNGSSTNLNSNSLSQDDKETSGTSTQDGEKENKIDATITYKETKSEAPKKNENSSTTKRPISGTIQFIGSLRRYLQPNKYKNSDDINALTKKFTPQNINCDNQIH